MIKRMKPTILGFIANSVTLKILNKVTNYAYISVLSQILAIVGLIVFVGGSVAKFDCIFALVQCCAILFSKKPKAGTIHDN